MSDYIEILHRVSNRLTNVTDELGIYQIMNDAIKQILPDSYFIITKLQPDDMNFRIIHSFGFDSYFTAIQTLIGKDPFQVNFPFDDLSESKKKIFQSRNIYHAQGGIHEIVNERLNKTICIAIEKILGISEVFAISFCVDDIYFGGAILFVPEANLDSGNLNKECTLTIETMAAQASFAINKLRDYEALAESEMRSQKKTELLSSIMESPKGMIIFSLDTNYCYTAFTVFHKETMKHIWGEDVEVGMNMLDIIHKVDDREKAKHNFDLALKGESLILTEEYGADDHGRTWWENRYSPIYSDKNTIVGLTVFVTDITERKKAEVELLNAEEKYRMITQASLDIIFILDKTGNIIFSNGSLSSLLGYQPSDFIGKSFTKFVPVKKLPQYLKKLTDVFLRKEIRDFNTQIYHKNGHLVDVDINGKLIYHEGKLAAQGTIRDITESNRLKNELLENQHRYIKSQELGHVGSWEYSFESELLRVSDESKRIFGLNLVDNDFTEVQIENCIPERERVHQALVDLVVNDKKYDLEYEIIPADKSSRKIVHSIAELERDASNKPLRVRGVILDITERKKSELALIESEKKYKSIFNNLPDVLWSLSYPGLQPLFISKSTKDLYGYNADQFLNDPMLWVNATHPDDRKYGKKALLEVKTVGKSTRESRIICPNGEVKSIMDRSWMIYENGKPIRIDGITKDVTIRKKAEHALKESEKQLKELNATKDKFFSIIAHDLKSPFNSMLGFSDILNNNFEDYDTCKQKKFIGLINQELQGTYKLLENLLYWSRSQRGTIEFKPEKLNVLALYSESYQLLIHSAQNKSIQLTSQIPSNLNVEADRDMLLTIIRNLISNAIKFTPKQGEISIEVNRIDEEKRVEIRVTDNGVGISKDTQSKLFDIGENTSTKGTENEKGTGLGLILCKEFVEKHNGKIWVQSEIGKGTTFTFTIPLKPTF